VPETPTVLWFGDIGRDDLAVAGGKGANLGELTQAGIPVPPGFVVSAPTYAAFIEDAGLRPRLAALLERVDPANFPGLQVLAREAKALLTVTPVPEAVAGAVAKAYQRLGGGPVAARSSATAEDLPGASFAGQQASFLNIRGAARVVEAVRECWASLFEPQAIAYRARAGYGHLDVAIAVVVQRMVQSERSGVMFTVNPVTGDRGQLVIEAVYGLGEAAVSGMVTPDTYIVDKASLAVLDRSVSSQEQELVGDPEAAGLEANVWREVPPDRRSAQKLSDEQIAELSRLGQRVEAHYGAPQDIEWALESGTLHLLQARPVTTV